MSETRDTGKDARGTVSLDDADAVQRVLADTLFGLWATVNNLTRIRPARHKRYRVTIFGSARTAPGHWVYDQVRQMAAAFTQLGCDIVTGGGPGLMAAANEGAHQAQAAGKGRSLGVRVELPFEQESNPFVEQVFEHQTFFTRLHQFVLMSDAYVVVPGGIGTVLETTLVWQLLQVRHLQGVPLVLTGPMWRELVDWARSYMLRPGFELASAPDMEIPSCVDGASEAIDIVRQHHARWLADANPAPAAPGDRASTRPSK